MRNFIVILFFCFCCSVALAQKSYFSDPERLGAIFASCDAYLGTGPYETFGLAILEALASGLPVVTTDEGAGAELAVNSAAGLLFRAGDADDLVEQARKLVAMDMGMLRRRARHYAITNGTWTRTFDLMFSHYSRLLARHRGEAVPAFEPPVPVHDLIHPVSTPMLAPAVSRRQIGAIAP